MTQDMTKITSIKTGDMGDDDTETEAEGDMTHENDNIDNEKDDNENREKTGNKTIGSNEYKSTMLQQTT